MNALEFATASEADNKQMRIKARYNATYMRGCSQNTLMNNNGIQTQVFSG